MLFTSNINTVVIRLDQIIEQKLNPEKYLRVLATNRAADIKKRVHIDGIASDGSQIGTYSDEYMKVRTNTGFKSSVIVRGKNKGEPRNPTNGRGFNRTQDTKVVASLTTNLENSINVIVNEKSSSVGYLLAFTKDEKSKIKLLEEKYNKKIWALTEGEKEANKEDIDFLLKNG